MITAQVAKDSTYQPPKILNRVLWEFRATNWILREEHITECTCSYCKDDKVGLVLPENKALNSWRSIRWKWKGNRHYLRWTLPDWWPFKNNKKNEKSVCKEA